MTAPPRGATAPAAGAGPPPRATSDAATAVVRAAAERVDEVLARLRVDETVGLDEADVVVRRADAGPNAVTSHHVRLPVVLWHQLRSPLLALLLVAAAASYVVGERSDAVIIGVIVLLSTGLGFVNEYRAERAADALHDQVRHRATVVRAGRALAIDVDRLVPGDVVDLRLGELVPADVRLTAVTGLSCDESVLTGESLPVEKDVEPTPSRAPLAELTSCALMGTVVTAGSGRGVVVATGPHAELGRIAVGLATHAVDTEFQVGLRRFSMLLVYVAVTLTSAILLINVLQHKPFIDALLFSLAIAVGITPQLLPAVVSSSLAAGSRRLRARRVLVKRLVCIEDLGNVDVVLTDKTGTLTQGRIEFLEAVPAGDGTTPEEVLRWGLWCTQVAGLGTGAPVDPALVLADNPLDQALWASAGARDTAHLLGGAMREGVLPFDHRRTLVSVAVRSDDAGATLVTKGAPEAVLARCDEVTPQVRDRLQHEFEAGSRVVAVATRPRTATGPVTAVEESGLRLVGLLVFRDPPKLDAAEALRRLHRLGVSVKVVTGDNPAVAVKVCRDLGLPVDDDHAVLTGAQLTTMDDDELAEAVDRTVVFARVSPEDKARIVRVRRRRGQGVAFLGDGVNDALALHAADVGISVDGGTDVAKDAADVILLEKDLGVLADGVAEGRRIFANTIKYVLMGTSSNVGNMVSAALASSFLSFLPMLPGQILLNNLLYDTSQLAIPTDEVDEEQLERPSHWDLGLIRRFMLVFGPLSSLFDLLTFAVMLRVLHAGPVEFRSGWFVESLATQTLVVFVIRTRRVPFVRSRPSLPLLLAVLGVVAVGAAVPFTPLATTLGFAPLPPAYFAALGAMVVSYLVVVEVGKAVFFRAGHGGRAPSPVPESRWHRIRRHQARRAAGYAVPMSPRDPSLAPGDSPGPRARARASVVPHRGGHGDELRGR